jgi:hypothetical protein
MNRYVPCHSKCDCEVADHVCPRLESIPEAKIQQAEMLNVAEKYNTDLWGEIALLCCAPNESVNCNNGACHFCLNQLRKYLIIEGPRILANRGRAIHVLTFVDTMLEVPVGKLHTVDMLEMRDQVKNVLNEIASVTGKRILAIGAVEACINDRQHLSSEGKTRYARSLSWAPHFHVLVTGCRKSVLTEYLSLLISGPQTRCHTPIMMKYSHNTPKAIAYATKRNTHRREIIKIDNGSSTCKHRPLRRSTQAEFDNWLGSQRLHDRFIFVGLPHNEITVPNLD